MGLVSIGSVIAMTAAEFDELVAEALDTIPDELAGLIDNCVIMVEDFPPPNRPSDLLGLYEGIPLTERGEFYSGVLPDKITIYRRPTLAICNTFEQVVEEGTSPWCTRSHIISVSATRDCTSSATADQAGSQAKITYAMADRQAKETTPVSRTAFRPTEVSVLS